MFGEQTPENRSINNRNHKTPAVFRKQWKMEYVIAMQFFQSERMN